MFKKKILIKYIKEDSIHLAKINKGDWIDLHAATDVILKKGDFKLIPLGIAMKLPKGYEAIIAPRSSTFKKWGIIQTNGIGVVDETYCGDNDQWMMPVYATRDEAIRAGDRVCQFRIQKHQPKLLFSQVERLLGKNRGGFGSTGIR